MKKKFVDVVCLNDQLGNLKPLFIIWDNHEKIKILKILQVCQRASLKVGGSGIRYKCLLEYNRQKDLYYERGKWFLEIEDNML